MLEQILVCECHIYESVVYKCENRVSYEDGFESENPSALTISQMELSQSAFRMIFTKSRIWKDQFIFVGHLNFLSSSVYYSLLKYWYILLT